MGSEKKEETAKEETPKLGFAEAFAKAFATAMAAEHEEFEKMEPKYAPGEGVMEVVEPNGESHFGE